MKKVAYLLVVLMLGFIGVAQAAPDYDYDRIPQTPSSKPHAWLTVNSLDEQTVSLPSVSFNRLVVERNIHVGDMVLQITQPNLNDESKVQVSIMDDGGVDPKFLEENPISFFLVETETLAEISGGYRDYTQAYAIKMVYQDQNGEKHQERVGLIY